MGFYSLWLLMTLLLMMMKRKRVDCGVSRVVVQVGG